jgi:hypothetical protein
MGTSGLRTGLAILEAPKFVSRLARTKITVLNCSGLAGFAEFELETEQIQITDMSNSDFSYY